RVFRALQVDSSHSDSLFLEKRREMMPDKTSSTRVTTLRGTVAAQHGRNRLDQSLGIQCERPPIDIFEVKLNPAIKINVAAALDLPQTREPRSHAEPTHVRGSGDALYV